MPDYWESFEVVGERILEGDELLNLQQNNIFSMTELMYMTLVGMSREDDPRFTPQQKIAIKQKAIAVYEIIFDEGDFNFCAHNLSYAYRQIAAIAVLEGNRELALESLEKAAEYAMANDGLPEEKPYTSLPVNRLVYKRENTLTNNRGSFSAELLKHMEMDRYDGIRNEQRFMAVAEQLKNMG